jgi:dTDP-4-dehydrorhamnose reductase
LTKHAHEMSDEELTKIYLRPGLGLLRHEDCDKIIREMKKRNIINAAKIRATNKAEMHVATYGTYRS